MNFYEYNGPLDNWPGRQPTDDVKTINDLREEYTDPENAMTGDQKKVYEYWQDKGKKTTKLGRFQKHK